MRYIVRSVPQEIADEVRRTRRAPGYGHPAHLETARGTGPCRCCLRQFVPEREQGVFDALVKRHGAKWMVELAAAANYFAFLSGVVNTFEVPAPADGDKF